MNIKFLLENAIASSAEGAKIRERMTTSGVVLSIYPKDQEQYELLIKSVDGLREIVRILTNISKSPHRYVVNIVRP